MESAEKLLTGAGFDIVSYLDRGLFGSVYLGKRGGERITVKIPRVRNETAYTEKEIREFYEDNVEHLTREHAAYVACHGINGVPKGSDLETIPPAFFINGAGREFATSTFRKNGLLVITREFIPGKMMKKEEVIDPKYRKALEETVRECHDADVIGLDIDRTNVIIGPRGKPFLFDFGHAIFEGEVTRKEFDEGKAEDFRKLRLLYEPAPEVN